MCAIVPEGAFTLHQMTDVKDVRLQLCHVLSMQLTTMNNPHLYFAEKVIRPRPLVGLICRPIYSVEGPGSRPFVITAEPKKSIFGCPIAILQTHAVIKIITLICLRTPLTDRELRNLLSLRPSPGLIIRPHRIMLLQR